MDYTVWAQDCEHTIELINRVLDRKRQSLKAQISYSAKECLYIEIAYWEQVRRDVASTLEILKEKVTK